MRQFMIPSRYTNLVRGNFYDFPTGIKNTTESTLDIILIHAFPFDSGMFNKNFKDHELIQTLNNLAKNIGKIRIILPDMPGFGLSESFKHQPQDLVPYVDVIYDIVKFFDIKNLIIGGCSMGGYICLEYVEQYPQILKGLILIDTKPSADTYEQKKNRLDTIKKIKPILELIDESEQAKIIIEKTYLEYPEIQSFIDGLYSKIVSSKLINENQKKGQKLLRLMKRQSLIGIIHALNAMAGRYDRHEILKNFKGNILIIVGEDDNITPKEVAKNMENLTSNSDLKIIPSAGHISNFDQPLQFNKILLNWLSSKIIN